MDFIFDIVPENESFKESKKDILKFLKAIGVDTRFISYTSSKIYINNLRFSKFSRTKEKTFKKHYPNIEVLRSSLFQKICSKSSKVLANHIKPKQKILLPNKDDSINNLLFIIMEPYTRKYGVELSFDKNEKGIDLIAYNLILDEEVNHIFSEIFTGKGIDFNRKDKKGIYPFINIPRDWINSFLEFENLKTIKNKNDSDDVAESFMEFLSNVVPQFKDNVLKSEEFIEENLKIK
ncbi:ATPase [Methanobrevibacter sp. OttesenSCG-928-K11]|nr:ATPase [Methanobrevibacter sp. OttesenSCG-928-K11]MDL2270998.1 ATPase [Methanobrevibacter sp. OttesenSCG-928-I08]